jgi:hypothetical protein
MLKVGCMQGRALRSEEGKMLGSGMFQKESKEVETSD